MKIDKDIPLHTKTGDATRKYPFPDMEVGDSFLCNGFDHGQVGRAAWHWGRINDRKFSVRKTPEGHRCWRIK